RGAGLEVGEHRLPRIPAVEVLEVVGDLEGHPQVPTEEIEAAGDVLPTRQPRRGRATESQQGPRLALPDPPAALPPEGERPPPAPPSRGGPGLTPPAAPPGERVPPRFIPASSSRARVSKRSPPTTATMLPHRAFTVGRPRRYMPASTTSSWSRLAECTSS